MTAEICEQLGLSEDSRDGERVADLTKATLQKLPLSSNLGGIDTDALSDSIIKEITHEKGQKTGFIFGVIGGMIFEQLLTMLVRSIVKWAMSSN